MVALPPTHTLDYPLPANIDGISFADPHTAFIDSIPRLVQLPPQVNNFENFNIKVKWSRTEIWVL